MTTDSTHETDTSTPQDEVLPRINGERIQEVSTEAAKYRRRAQAAETERDDLRARLEQTQRNRAEQIAAGLERPEDLWEVLNVNLADYQTDTGDLDEQQLLTALETVKAERPYLFKRAPHVDLGQGQRERIPSSVTWAQAINPR